jgi:Flp pilus assembly protein TadG
VGLPQHKIAPQREQGFLITLVAIFMLFVVGAMAALSIDVVTFYTARSEAQLAADSAALAGARMLANSGITSSTDATLAATAQIMCQNIATQIAKANQISGQSIPSGQISANCNVASQSSPTVTVQVQVNLPTFFARIWGTRQVSIAASATAEAYNASGNPGTSSSLGPPVAPLCVKPWLLPNLDPITGTAIFDSYGHIADPSLLGYGPSTVQPICTTCSPVPYPPVVWEYYPGDPLTTFPPPTTTLPSCNPVLSTSYQESLAGCVQTPISCRQTANIDTSTYAARLADTADAVNCLTHATGTGGGDTFAPTNPPSAPFEFLVGSDNPLLSGSAPLGSSVMVSDSLVTVPVFDPTGFSSTSTSVPIIGFVQLFLNPSGSETPVSGPGYGYVPVTVVNMVGCAGTNPNSVPIIGNGASPVAVRLISH